MFMGPCIANVLPSITNKMQRYTIYLFVHNALHVSGGWKLVSSKSSTIAAGSSKGLTNTPCSMYSCELLMMGGGTA